MSSAHTAHMIAHCIEIIHKIHSIIRPASMALSPRGPSRERSESCCLWTRLSSFDVLLHVQVVEWELNQCVQFGPGISNLNLRQKRNNVSLKKNCILYELNILWTSVPFLPTYFNNFRKFSHHFQSNKASCGVVVKCTPSQPARDQDWVLSNRVHDQDQVVDIRVQVWSIRVPVLNMQFFFPSQFNFLNMTKITNAQ